MCRTMSYLGAGTFKVPLNRKLCCIQNHIICIIFWIYNHTIFFCRINAHKYCISVWKYRLFKSVFAHYLADWRLSQMINLLGDIMPGEVKHLTKRSKYSLARVALIAAQHCLLLLLLPYCTVAYSCPFPLFALLSSMVS